MIISKYLIIGSLIGFLVLGVWGGYWRLKASEQETTITQLTDANTKYKESLTLITETNKENDKKTQTLITTLQKQLKEKDVELKTSLTSLSEAIKDYNNSKTVEPTTIEKGVLDEETSKKRISDRNATIANLINSL